MVQGQENKKGKRVSWPLGLLADSEFWRTERGGGGGQTARLSGQNAPTRRFLIPCAEIPCLQTRPHSQDWGLGLDISFGGHNPLQSPPLVPRLPGTLDIKPKASETLPSVRQTRPCSVLACSRLVPTSDKSASLRPVAPGTHQQHRGCLSMGTLCRGPVI